MFETVVLLSHGACLVIVLLSLYGFFAEADVISKLQGEVEASSVDIKDVFVTLAMCPVFFFLNTTRFVPQKWRDVFRVVASFFFINHFQLGCCGTKSIFDKLSTNSTIDQALNLTPDQIRIARASMIGILMATGAAFLVAFLLEGLLKKTQQDQTLHKLLTSSNTASPSTSPERTTIATTTSSSASLPIALKITYVISAFIIIAATGVLMSTGDACIHFSASDSQMFQTFPAIALMLLSGVILNDYRALDIAVSLLLLNVVSWQPTAYTDGKMMAVSALLQSSADVLIVGITITAVVEARHKHFSNQALHQHPTSSSSPTAAASAGATTTTTTTRGEDDEGEDDNSQSAAAAAAAAAAAGGGGGGGSDNNSPSVSLPPLTQEDQQQKQQQTARIASALSVKTGGGALTLVDRLRSAGFKLAAWCWVIGIIGGNMIFPTAPDASAIWIAFFAGFFVPLWSLVSTIYGIDAAFVPAAFAGLRCSTHLAADLSGTSGWVRSGWLLLIVAAFGAAASSLRLPRGDADTIVASIQDDVRVSSAFLLSIVSALTYRSQTDATHDDFLRSLYLAVLILVSVARPGAGTVAFLAAASYAASIKLWFVDNNSEVTNLPACLFAAALWMFMLFNPKQFRPLPMHSCLIGQNADDFFDNLSDNDDDVANQDEAGLGSELKKNSNVSNVSSGYGTI